MADPQPTRRRTPRSITQRMGVADRLHHHRTPTHPPRQRHQRHRLRHTNDLTTSDKAPFLTPLPQRRKGGLSTRRQIADKHRRAVLAAPARSSTRIALYLEPDDGRVTYWLAPGRRVVLLTVIRKAKTRKDARAAHVIAVQAERAQADGASPRDLRLIHETTSPHATHNSTPPPDTRRTVVRVVSSAMPPVGVAT